MLLATLGRNKVLPAVTILASAPLLFSSLLKAPPLYLRGDLFVLVWSWGILSVFLAPVFLAVEAGVLIGCLFIKPRVSFRALLPHMAAAIVSLGGIVVFLAVRYR